jgi:signal transduction histidine kinase
MASVDQTSLCPFFSVSRSAPFKERIRLDAGRRRPAAGADPAGAIQAWIEDRGTGIDVEHLPRAALERGYTTAGAMGHGFWMVLRTCDRVWLLTCPTGATVVLEQDRTIPEPAWLRAY